MQWCVSISVCVLISFNIPVQADCDNPAKMVSLKYFSLSIHILSHSYLCSLELPISVLIYTFPNPWQHFLLCCGNSATVIVCLFLKGCLYALDKFSRIWYCTAASALFSPCPTVLIYINTLSLHKNLSGYEVDRFWFFLLEGRDIPFVWFSPVYLKHVVQPILLELSGKVHHIQSAVLPAYLHTPSHPTDLISFFQSTAIVKEQRWISLNMLTWLQDILFKCIYLFIYLFPDTQTFQTNTSRLRMWSLKNTNSFKWWKTSEKFTLLIN